MPSNKHFSCSEKQHEQKDQIITSTIGNNGNILSSNIAPFCM